MGSDDAYIDWKRWDGDSFGSFDRDEAVYFRAETGLTDHTAARILEIGFGNGGFLGWAASLGAQVHGVELNPQLVLRARQRFARDAFFDSLDDQRLNACRGQFSLLIAFDVIEHVTAENLPKMLDRMRTLLQPEGRIIVRFPNGDSPFGRHIQHGDPTHSTTLGRDKLAYYAASAGLKILEIRAPALPIRGLGAGRGIRRAGIRLSRAAIEKIVSMLYFGGRRIPLDPNYVAILVHSKPTL